MRKTISLLLFLLSIKGMTQIDANSLLGLPVATTTDINAISTATIQEGALVFDTNRKKVYAFNGTEWKELLTSPSVDLKTTNYTLVEADNGNILTFNSATDVTLTVPTGLPIGFNISIYQIGNGKVTISGAAGVTIKNRLSRFRTAGLDAGAGIVCTATNIFHVTGDLKTN
ncbi:hypothetical protein [Aquimarina sp. 2201CG5-10]|uniref:hypothetical protein n=1 Tax=Aquimarina callyspongiae TaxID=3098150 RepID=UPI002AB4CF2D|nr:hypothetical protein [Aquimarina sp. 2201CG5-10]MDY8135607.1 hypothetical protein [Aquimarina sp. 2201CG5-10]